MDQKEEWMVFKVKQSPEEKKVIELISFMVLKLHMMQLLQLWVRSSM